MACEYEQIRLKNLADNKRILAELGLLNKPFQGLPKLLKRAPKRKREPSTPRPAKKIIINNGDTPEIEGYGSIRGSTRRSSRLQGKDAPQHKEISEEVEQWLEDEDAPRARVTANRPNVYGLIPGVEMGTIWATRVQCCAAGIHRPTVAGIHGGADSCYSIALSGGYQDDIDLGEGFTYTGEGGRDLKGTKVNPKNLRTAPQSKDQTLTRGNLALSKNVETGYPVRVIRGYKLKSPYAPEEGYRYDGLYKVEKAWFTIGVSGFGVWKFALKRLEDQAAPPWEYLEGKDDKESESGLSSSQDSGVGSEQSSEIGNDARSDVGNEDLSNHGDGKSDTSSNHGDSGDASSNTDDKACSKPSFEIGNNARSDVGNEDSSNHGNGDTSSNHEDNGDSSSNTDDKAASGSEIGNDARSDVENEDPSNHGDGKNDTSSNHGDSEDHNNDDKAPSKDKQETAAKPKKSKITKALKSPTNQPSIMSMFSKAQK